MTTPSLAGRTIALPEHRELDRFAELVEAAGARTVRCPLVSILDAPDAGPIDAWLDRLLAGAFDVVVFLTGEGVRRLAARHEARTPDPAAARAAFVQALSRCQKVTRGPKPARALHELGLATDLAAREPTSAGVAAALAAASLSGKRVGLQLYGTEPNEPLVSALQQAGAEVHPVAPYVYAPASDERAVLGLVERLAAGEIDALAFTSASQIDRLFAIARKHERAGQLEAGLARTKVAAIGPIAVDALASHGVRVDVAPGPPWILKRLAAALESALAAPG